MVGGWSRMVGSEVERQPSWARKIFRDAGIEDELVVSTRVDPTMGTAHVLPVYFVPVMCNPLWVSNWISMMHVLQPFESK